MVKPIPMVDPIPIPMADPIPIVDPIPMVEFRFWYLTISFDAVHRTITSCITKSLNF